MEIVKMRTFVALAASLFATMAFAENSVPTTAPVDAATRSALNSLRAATAPKVAVREPDPADVAKMLAAEREHLRALEEAWKARQPKEPQPK